jgi:hypothetical protein
VISRQRLPSSSRPKGPLRKENSLQLQGTKKNKQQKTKTHARESVGSEMIIILGDQ